MKKRVFYIAIFCLVQSLFLLNVPLFAKSIAFGYFYNSSSDTSFDYLEQVLPNSFSSSLKAKYGFDIVKPSHLTLLKSYEKDGIKINLEDRDLLKLSKDIPADYFIYGDYEPTKENKIRITVKVYATNGKTLFTFKEEGKLEAEIFKIVDNISYKISNIASERLYYKSEAIANNSKISIITNIEGEELNIVYNEFLKKGYRLFMTQGNDLYTILDEDKINLFYTVTAPNASYVQITDRSSIEIPLGTWSGPKYRNDAIKQKNLYNENAFYYEKTMASFLSDLKKLDNNLFDYSIIIGFNKEKNSAWIRCIDVKRYKLILTETGITGSDISEITQKLIDSLSSKLPENF